MPDALADFLEEARVNGHTVKRFRSDSGKEFDNQKTRKLLTGIEFIVECLYMSHSVPVFDVEGDRMLSSARLLHDVRAVEDIKNISRGAHLFISSSYKPIKPRRKHY